MSDDLYFTAKTSRNAATDAKAFEQFVNGGETEDVSYRTGGTFPTARKTLAGIEQNATAAANTALALSVAVNETYDTKAAADAALGGLSDGDKVLVRIDESAAGQRSLYEVVSSAYDLIISYPAKHTRWPSLVGTGGALAALDAGVLQAGDGLTIDGHTAPGDDGGWKGVVEATANALYPGGGRIRPKGKTVRPEMWGDTIAAFQQALDYLSSRPYGGVLVLQGDVYETIKVEGVNDKWGLNVSGSRIQIRGKGRPVIKRSESSIGTYAESYPVMMIGVPDNNAAAPVEDVLITGVEFEGLDTRHTVTGSYLHDGRTAILAKNTRGLKIKGNRFSKIDSSAILFQWPASYDYAYGEFFNTTKSYDAVVSDNRFEAEPHTTARRALLHAVLPQGCDGFDCRGNSFSWCDNAVASEDTYELADQAETDTYAPGHAGWTLGNVKRSGRSLRVAGNEIYNSSEHALYLSSTDIVVEGNTIRTDEPTICTGSGIKLRSRFGGVNGNTISGYRTGISINEPCIDVTVSGNTIASTGATGGGAIDVNADTLTTYHDQRPWLTAYRPMSGITITGNTISFSGFAGLGLTEIGFRIHTSTSQETNFPSGTIFDVKIANNTVRNHRHGVYIAGVLARNVDILGNTFLAKPFDRSGFDSSTTLDTVAAMVFNVSSANASKHIRFRDNIVEGSEYIFTSDTGGGSGIDLPWGVSGNRLNYIQTLASPAFGPIIAVNIFTGNHGLYFLDRTWIGNVRIGNSLHDGTSSSSGVASQLLYDGSKMRYYDSDTSFVNLN